jgi:diguanylate cyclase (GGDEF)-like protein/PAS domain S-box-containing protein
LPEIIPGKRFSILRGQLFMMNDQTKTNAELIEEISALSQRIRDLEQSESERKRDSEALRESEEYFKAIIQNSSDIILILDKRGTITYASSSVERFLGYGPDELIGERSLDLIMSDDKPQAIADFGRALLTKEVPIPNVLRIKHKNGTERILEGIGKNLLDNPIVSGFVMNVRDITDRKQAEQALRESENRLSSIIHGFSIPAFVIGKDHKVLYWNQALERLSKIPAAEVVGTNQHWRAFYAHERPCMADLLVDELIDKIPQWYEEKYVKSSLIDGAYEATNFFPALGENGRLLRFTAAAIRDFHGNLVGAVETLEDVTEHKRAEERLRESEERYRALVENASDIVFRTDETGHFTFINPAGLNITGYEEKEIIGRHYPTLIRQDMRDEAIKFFGLQFVKGIKNTYSEYPILTKEGHEVWFGQNTQLIVEDGHVIGFQSVSRDITDRNQADKMLRNSEERFKSLYQDSPIPTFTWQKKGDDFILVDFNKAAMQMTDGKIFDHLGASAVELYRNRPQVFSDLNLCFQERSVISRELTSNHFAPGRFLTVNYGFIPPDLIIVHTEDQTDRKRAEERLRESEEKYKMLAEKSMAGVYVVQDGKFRFINSNAASYAGYTREELLDREAGMLVVSPEDKEKVRRNAKAMMLGEMSSPYEFRIITKQGETRWIMETVTSILHEGRPAILGNSMNITERRQIEEELRENRSRLADIVTFLPDATLAIDKEKRIIIWNKAIEEMTGVPAAEMIGKGDYAYTIPFYGEARPQLMDLVFLDREEIEARYSNITHEGDSLMAEAFCNALYNNKGAWIFAKASPLHDQYGNIIGAIEIVRDITAQKQAEEKIQQMAYHDSLTGLPNRKLFSDRLGIALAQAQRNQKGVAVTMLDLDNFKNVNDTLGHDVGDLLLKAAAERLSAALRKGDTVARFGGDEFVLILPDLKGIEDVIQVAQKIVDGFRKPFLIDTHQLIVTTSIGIAVYPHDGTDEGILLKNADIAMYQVKQTGRDRYQLCKKA